MPTVGEILSAERRRQGKQLSDVVEGTKIRSRLIDALEQGRYDDLPSQAYVKGYIQSYARYLEIPAEPLLEQYKSESVDIVRRDTPIDRYLAAIPADTIVPKRGTAHEIPRSASVAVVVGVVLFVLLLCAISQFAGCNGQPALWDMFRAKESTTTPAASPSAGTSTTGTGTATTTDLGPLLRISIRKGLASSVKVTVDGLTKFNGSMQDGASYEYRFREQAVLVIGNPDAVVVTRDGQTQTVTANVPLTLTAEN